jgi:UDP-N-acetylenolpyruvoylglucosamine reductase
LQNEPVKTSDFLQLVEIIKKKVLKDFNIILETEVIIV